MTAARFLVHAVECDSESCMSRISLVPPVYDDVARAAVRVLGWTAGETSTIQHCPMCVTPTTSTSEVAP